MRHRSSLRQSRGLGQPESEAAVELRLALSLDSQVPELHYNMGLVYERSGRYASAAEELQVARGLDPENLEIQKALLRVWYRLRRNDPEMQELIRSLRARLDDPVWVGWLNTLTLEPAPPAGPKVPPTAEAAKPASPVSGLSPTP